MKKCRKCGIEKPLDEFHKCSRNKDGKDSACIKCVNAGHKARRAKNRASYNANKRAYWKQHRDKGKVNAHKWYDANKDKISAKRKIEREINPTIHRARNKKYYNANRDKVLRRNHKNEQKRLQNDPMFKIARNLRKRVNAVLKGTSKSDKTLQLLGCSLEFFKEYLEQKFRDGMTWENYGTIWHLDHIKPCSKFDLLLIDEQKKCFRYTNLQPLLVLENLKKHNKY
ncbi:MAG: hypothetical protein WC389_19190 [Lutibacter sp.]|jgi:hypothetical protein